jgi:hypothetical protein
LENEFIESITPFAKAPDRPAKGADCVAYDRPILSDLSRRGLSEPTLPWFFKRPDLPVLSQPGDARHGT